MTHIVHPILLAGGSGTRLWPLSRKSYPKQFAKLMGEHSLFQASAKRLAGGGLCGPGDLDRRGLSICGDRAAGRHGDRGCGHSH